MLDSPPDQSSAQETDSKPDGLARAVAEMVRGDWGELGNLMIDVEGLDVLQGVRVNFHCLYVASGPNYTARVKTLARLLAKQIVLYCIPRSEILAATSLPPDQQVEEITRLTLAAQSLFTSKQPTTGEGGELLLYSLLEKRLGAPQILSKMSLKTNTEVQIHGVDGVHAKLLEDETLAVYWGESKLYGDVQGALSECFNSLAPYLLGESDEQDVFLIKHYMDAGLEEVTVRLLEYFDDASQLSGKVEVRGACFIGFTHNDYPVLPRDQVELGEQIRVVANGWAKGVRSRVVNKKLEKFEIEVFCVPVPDAPAFRAAIQLAVKGSA